MPDAGEGNLTSLVLNQRPKAVLWDHHLSRNHFGFGVLPNHGRIIAHTENDMANQNVNPHVMAFLTGEITEAELGQRLSGKGASKPAKPKNFTAKATAIGVSERSKSGNGKERFLLDGDWGTLYRASGTVIPAGSKLTITFE